MIHLISYYLWNPATIAFLNFTEFQFLTTIIMVNYNNQYDLNGRDFANLRIHQKMILLDHSSHNQETDFVNSYIFKFIY